MSRERRHIPLLVWLGISVLLHSGTLGGVHEIAQRIVRTTHARRIATGSSPIELAFEPVDLVQPTAEATVQAPLAPAPPLPRSSPDPQRHSLPERTRPEDALPLAHREQPVPPPFRAPEVQPPRVSRPVNPSVPDQPQQWAHQTRGNQEAAPDGLLAQVDNNVAEETVRRSEERSSERHPEGQDAVNAPGRLHEAPPARPSPRPPREDPPRSTAQVTPASPPPASGAPTAPREAGALRGERGARGTPGDGRPPGTAGAPGMLAAAGNTERSLGNTDVNAGTGGLSGSGTARGEAGQNGANGTGGSHGASGELGQGGQALLRGPGGNGEAPARRVGIEGLGAARALAVLSPTLQTFDAVYDRETRDRWRREDERRRADARGDYASNWRAALATLDTPVAVRPGETTALRTRASPFAAYIVQLHDRIHERFAEGFIGRVMAMPSNSPLHDPSLHTALEIVINRDGTIHRMAVAQTSGVLAFDVGAIDSVRASTPFPPPPEAILSGDGHVYVHWHFRRSVNFCNDARPFILRGRSTTPTPPATQPTRERTNEPEEGSGTVPPDGGAPPDSATEPPRRPPMVPDTPGAQRTASSHSIPGPSSAS